MNSITKAVIWSLTFCCCCCCCPGVLWSILWVGVHAHAQKRTKEGRQCMGGTFRNCLPYLWWPQHCCVLKVTVNYKQSTGCSRVNVTQWHWQNRQLLTFQVLLNNGGSDKFIRSCGVVRLNFLNEVTVDVLHNNTPISQPMHQHSSVNQFNSTLLLLNMNVCMVRSRAHNKRTREERDTDISPSEVINNNNGYSERLTHTGSKHLHILYMYMFSRFNAHTHTHAHTRTHAPTHT